MTLCRLLAVLSIMELTTCTISISVRYEALTRLLLAFRHYNPDEGWF